MITIRNINANLSEAGVEFTQETLQAAMDEMSQTVRDCGYEGVIRVGGHRCYVREG